MTNAFSAELGRITSGVNCIDPPATETLMLPKLGAAKEASENIEAAIPMGGGQRNPKIRRMRCCTRPHTDLQWSPGLCPPDVDGARGI